MWLSARELVAVEELSAMMELQQECLMRQP
jgi:hypothetical protein